MSRENRSKAALRFEMSDTELLKFQQNVRDNFKHHLKDYYETLKKSGNFQKNERLTKEDVLRVAQSLGNKNKIIGNVILKFWGNRLTLSELNQMLEQDGFFN